MLKELALQQWKSFDDATLHIDPLTILIGTNASGKSNALDALTFLQRVASGAGVFQAINGDLNLPALRGGTEWVCRKPDRLFTLTAIVEAGEELDYRFELTVQVNGSKAEVSSEGLYLLRRSGRRKAARETRLYHASLQNEHTPGIAAYFSTGKKGPGRRIDVNRSHLVLVQAETLNVRKDIQEGIRIVKDVLQRIFVFDPIPSHMRDYAPFAETLLADGSNIAGVLAALDDPKQHAVLEQLTHYLQRLPERDVIRVWTEAVGKFQTDAMLYCLEGWAGVGDHVVDARGMSDGTLRYLAIVAAVLTRQPGTLLVVEEVDNGLHPSRADVLVDMLRTLGRERGVDIIVTTHNPALLDAAGPSMIPFITVVHRNSHTGASVLTHLDDIEQLPKLMAAGTLGRMSTAGLIENALQDG